MAGDQTSPPPRSGLSLYANLLESDAPGTISGAPVSYTKANEASPEQDEAAKKQQALTASLRFQPTKRPQLTAQKAKAKAIANKFAQHVSSAVPSSQSAESRPGQTSEVPAQPPSQSVAPKTTAADWTATLSEDEDTHAYYASTRQKRKKRKKNKEVYEVQQNWDDIYDPSRPNNYEEYKHSEEKIREVREWKDLLYRHRTSRRRSSDYDSDGSPARPMNRQFAPPPMSFAPPASFDDQEKDEALNNEDGEDDYVPPPPPATSNITDDASGEDAYLRRLRMSQPGIQQGHSATPPPPPPPPPPSTAPTVPAPPPGQVSRAPVRYNLPLAPTEIPASEAELEAKLESETDNVEDDNNEPDSASTSQPRSNRPGQAGFAERLMMKYGWTKGSGLGASGSGITSALYAKADKRKKKSDAEGGGYVAPATTGKILGGTRAKDSQHKEEGKFGAMSEVVRLEDMLDGIDVQEELRRTTTNTATDQEEGEGGGGGGLMQEIGQECGEKYGSVERVFIHTTPGSGKAVVFVKFVSQLSALRAVNALEGRMFNGNLIKARFWDLDKFDAAMYE